jgi:DNA-binding NtrC family response regulator
VLFVADQPHGAESIPEELVSVTGNMLTASDPAAAVTAARRSMPDLVVVREAAAPEQTLALVTHLRQSVPQAPVVVISGTPQMRSAVEFVRAGAAEYLDEPLGEEDLARLVSAANTGEGAAGRRDRYFCEHCPPGLPMVGRSEGMAGVLEKLRLVAESNCNPVLVVGPTGSGKELAARAVHQWRCPEDAEFVAVNCAALTANLLESELFGHAKGSFTGADREKTGLFEVAGAGTIFLDEISEMALELQAKLLRVLQEKTFRKVGGTRDIRCRATIIASSNRDLLAAVKAGQFRKDLYYRLAVFPIVLPALSARDRREDIVLLADYFVETSTISSRSCAKGLSEAAARELRAHDWPGNVRELRNVVDRALILEKSEIITPQSLMFDRSEDGEKPPPADRPQPSDFSLETAEREFILRALRETGGQRTRAAALLGITRATLHAKLKRYAIEIPSPNGSSAGKGTYQPAPPAKPRPRFEEMAVVE